MTSQYTTMVIESSISDLVEQMDDMDLRDVPKYRGIDLLPLGALRQHTKVGGVTCTVNAYLGRDGKIYIEGPHRKLGGVTIGIHPHKARDKRISLNELAELLTAYMI